MGDSPATVESIRARRKEPGTGVVDVDSSSRRNFLAKVAATLGAVASWKLAGSFAKEVAGVGNDETLATSGVLVAPIEKSHITSVLNMVYPYSSLEELARKVRETEADMASKLEDEELSRADDYVQAITSAANNSKAKLPLEIRDLMFGLLIQESSGNQYAESYDREGNLVARGPFQITEEMGKAHNLKMDGKGDERFDLFKSATVAALQLRSAYDYWKDWGMAIWEWHAGRTQLQDIVGLYLSDNYQGEANRNRETIPDKLGQYHLDVAKILSYKVLDAKLNDPKSDWDYTSKFLYRVVAGTLAYKRRAETVQAATLR